jgi:hypothetical protein
VSLDTTGRRAVPVVARWTSLTLATVTLVPVAWVPIGLVLSVRRSVGWAIERPMGLLGGALLTGIATAVTILPARSAWRGRVRP